MNAKPHPSFPDDREPLAFFAGRERELSTLRDKAERTLESAGEATKGIKLITGVPGAGKTTLAHRFGSSLPKNVRFLAINVSLLSHVDGMFDAVAKAVDPVQATKARRRKKTSSNASVNIGVVKGRKSKEVADAELPATNLNERLRESKEAGLWKGKALTLLIDELQTVRPEHRDNLEALHYGEHGCPILVVGAGLQHTPGVLVDLGISRVSRPMAIHSLDEEAAWNVFAANAEFYAGVTDIPEPFMERLLEASHRFPQHIHGYLEGIVEVTKERGSNSVRDAATQRQILEHGDHRRTAYYNDRLNSMRRAMPEMPSPHRLLAPVLDAMERSGAPLDVDVVKDVLKKSGAGYAVLDSAVRHGVLRDVDGLCDFGIPSFHSHMEQLCRIDRTQTQAKADSLSR